MLLKCLGLCQLTLLSTKHLEVVLQKARFFQLLLGLILATNKGELHGNQRNLGMGLDECKTFLIARNETTATLLSFMFLLLANHPDWQEHLREEIVEVCRKMELPTPESLNHMKLVGMVMNETSTLYP
ncbi:hypothetical protein GOP47_0012504 [Adiantum capillus-veneris]|uniref:Cytochrome P450 n=1 Tax=Adiantum capillus-veneris TaxID=13818 RepID=A0A9D4ZED4_ADICA|nr:hypothetical protein GOP47_0012504 [Adiantum capillus-veneris]